MRTSLTTALVLTATVALAQTATPFTAASTEWKDNELFDKTYANSNDPQKKLASKKPAGEWISTRKGMWDWFLKPGTLYDGCYNRVPPPPATPPVVTAPRTWWTIDGEIKTTKDEILLKMKLFTDYDTCLETANKLFDDQKTTDNKPTATVTSEFKTQPEYDSGYQINPKVAPLQATVDTLTK